MHAIAAAPRRIDLGNARPQEIASRLSREKGFLFLDSAIGPAPRGGQESREGSISILSAHPRQIIHGNLGHPAELRNALQAGATREAVADWGIPLGGAFGTVEFDGNFLFGLYDDLLLFDHSQGEWYQVGNGGSLLEALPGAPPDTPPGNLSFEFEMGREPFCAMVRRAQEYIAAGDIYQVSLSHRASAPWRDAPGAAWAFYRALRCASPTPQGAFIELGASTVLCASPECFLRISGNLVSTRPIKGTRPRFSDPDHDERSAYDLLTSSKEIAELVMITDLERNDLGRICKYGSIHVPELLVLERFAQVFHLVSTVEGEVRRGIDHLEVLCACFPGGSISGAPKKRALEIIDELEVRPRGLYTGAIGYFGYNGESQFNIAIRTALIDPSRREIHFHVGAGIVADS
ncbi:MAG: anthranilate synthase component I family protein, partial [Verrucomicrobiales bacterium]